MSFFDKTSVNNALDKLDDGLRKYLWIQENYLKVNVQEDSEFQKKFNHFYKVRRDQTWRSKYFELLEKNKNSVISFEKILEDLFLQTGRFESSFSSKLIATVNPNMPVIDSVVMRNLGLKIPIAKEERLQKTVELYNKLIEKVNELILSDDGINAISMFKQKYPNTKVTQVKILDLILWQSR